MRSATLLLPGSCFALLLGSGMRAVVDLGHLPDRQLRVSLRRGEPLMPQQLLDRPQIRALLQHVRAKRVPQRVRMDIRRQPAAD